MRDDVYKQFSTKMKAILKDCIVTEDVADTDYTTYRQHVMSFAPNKGQQFFYNRIKIIDNYADDIKNLFSIVPQINNSASANRKFVTLQSLVSDDALSEPDKSKKSKILKAQASIIEAFFVFSQDLHLGTMSTDTKIPVFTLNQRIPTNYQENSNERIF